MSDICEGCDSSLDRTWVACPYCGRPVSGKAGSEKLIRIITKVGSGLLEAGLLQAEASAEEKGDSTRAAQIALARNLAKDIAPKIADAVTTYVYQRQVLSEDPDTKRDAGTKKPVLALPPKRG
jgi:hypothetical protein